MTEAGFGDAPARKATGFAELVAATNYSFLRGASHPGDMVRAAHALGLAGIGIADRNSVAGVVRAQVAWRELDDAAFRLVVGARLVFADGTPDIIAYPATRTGWARLCRLLTLGNLRGVKGDCILHLADLLGHAQDLLLIVMAGEGADVALAALAAVAPDARWLGVTMARRGDDRRRLAGHIAVAAAARVPLLATNDVLYATPDARPLHDVLTCIAAGVTVATAGRRLLANAERHIKPAAEIARLFADCPEAVLEPARLLARIGFSLDQLRYEYPHEPVPDGWTPQSWLQHIVLAAAHARHPDGLPLRLVGLLDEEFALIAKLDYAVYFLTVHDIVAFAQGRGILCQGRGSAANSVVCFLLGITAVDPLVHNLLFSRFMSEERAEPPDIDVDFEHERREEVMQYIYARYGRHRAGIAATVIHYRPRSAVREVGKVLGLSEDVTGRLNSTVWGSYPNSHDGKRYDEAGFDAENPEIARLGALVAQILTFPRHLSQHVGGFVLTEGRLDELVPIHNAAMEGRTFIEWDKDDIDALGLMKVDVLALGMLTCIRKAFAMLPGLGLTLDNVPHDDAVYDMLCTGDSIGVFQVESRAQINMLPRLRPREFYDLVIQVAIVRPGPIQGDMVHPYLRRRQGLEAHDFPSPAPPHDPHELRGILGKTLGVPLFQEQAMKLAIVAAGFSPVDANRLRRAMATFRNLGTMDNFRAQMVTGMVARGYEEAFALRCFRQIEGFGSYGFPESHALAFARLVYVSAWLKCHHPAVFAASLLNAQPMGFYAPAQIVRDAREHGVDVREIDINASDWDNRVDGTPAPIGVGTKHPASLIPSEVEGPAHALVGPSTSLGMSEVGLGKTRQTLRLGFRQIDGFREIWAGAIAAARPYASVEDLARRAQLPTPALRLLADADACRSIGMDRRVALWEVRRTAPDALPLFAAADARELADEADTALPAMPLAEQVATDYQTIRLSLKAHPMAFLRELFMGEGVLSCADLARARDGRFVRVAGLVLVRQRPGNGKAIFATLEDETGVANILIWERTFERQRRQVMAARLMEACGQVQVSREGVVHLIVSRVIDRSAELDRLVDDPLPATPRRGGGHPRDARIIPKSRDFH